MTRLPIFKMVLLLSLLGASNAQAQHDLRGLVATASISATEDSNDYKAEIRGRMDGIYACAEERSSGRAGVVRTSFTVLADGRLSNVAVKSRFSKPEVKLEACIRKLLKETVIQTDIPLNTIFRFSFSFAGVTQVQF